VLSEIEGEGLRDGLGDGEGEALVLVGEGLRGLGTGCSRIALDGDGLTLGDGDSVVGVDVGKNGKAVGAGKASSRSSGCGPSLDSSLATRPTVAIAATVIATTAVRLSPTRTFSPKGLRRGSLEEANTPSAVSSLSLARMLAAVSVLCHGERS
jgi:hypothetical protein